MGLWACCPKNWQTRRAARWKQWHPDRDGQAERSLCPVEERTAHSSPFGRRITSFPGVEESVRVKGRAQRGRDPPGAEGNKRKGEIGRRKSPKVLPETCHPGRVGHHLLHSLPHSLPPSFSQCLLPASRQGEPGAKSCWLASLWWPRDKEGETFSSTPLPHSIVVQIGNKGMLSSHTPLSLASPPRPKV